MSDDRLPEGAPAARTPVDVDDAALFAAELAEVAPALPSRHGLVSVAHLVERGAEREYRVALEVLRHERPDLRFLVTGPWPPYSFGE